MTYTFKLSRRLATLPSSVMPIALLVALIGCNDDSSLTGDSSGPTFDSAASSPVITPQLAVAQTNQGVQFKVRSRSGGGSNSPTVQWTASGGTITQTGLFTASSPGKYKVTAQSRQRQKSDSAIVTV